MKVSTEWLQTFFDSPLPKAEEIAHAFTFHSSEIEEVEEKEGDTVLDVKVLPDKSAWMLSHRGVAKELSTILSIPLAHDSLRGVPECEPASTLLSVTLDTDTCISYRAALVRGVTVGPSPLWLQKRLQAIGQRSINNIVDATNYVMFHLGQPLHAFDAKKLSAQEGKYEIGVRMAHAGEQITTLTDDTYTLTPEDTLIIDRTTDTPIGIAGVKGGAHARVDESTTDLILESASFDRIAVRKTAQRLKLRTDASARYENGVPALLTGYGIVEVVRLITEVAGGTLEGYVTQGESDVVRAPVSVSLTQINSVLGLSLSQAEVSSVFDRFGYTYTWVEDIITVTPPPERDDLVIAQDLIEEVGRMHGLSHIVPISPNPIPLREFNTSFYYIDAVRRTLSGLGFSEVFTSSFRNRDAVKLANALASDKGYLRSGLRENLAEALSRNVPHKDLLGMPYVAIFEIGTVFASDQEYVALSFGVRTGATYSAKKDDPILQEAIVALTDIFGTESYDVRDGIAECNLTAAIADLPPATSYAPFMRGKEVTYQPFSLYPSMSRDIALWVGEGTSAEDVQDVLNGAAGLLRVRTTCFDDFTKDGRTSFAFRLVFQASDRTLTDSEVNGVMDQVYAAVTAKGWEVR